MTSLTPEITDYCDHCHQPIFKTESDRPVIEAGVVVLNPFLHTVFVDRVPVHFTAREFQLLYFLASRKGKVCSKDTIFMCVWGFDSDAELKIVDVIICKIRHKLGDQRAMLQTHWGRGYSFGDATVVDVGITDNVLSS